MKDLPRFSSALRANTDLEAKLPQTNTASADLWKLQQE